MKGRIFQEPIISDNVVPICEQFLDNHVTIVIDFSEAGYHKVRAHTEKQWYDLTPQNVPVDGTYNLNTFAGLFSFVQDAVEKLKELGWTIEIMVSDGSGNSYDLNNAFRHMRIQ